MLAPTHPLQPRALFFLFSDVTRPPLLFLRMLLSQFEKLKLPSYGTMPGVAFHCSDLQMSENGPRVLIFGGQRQGISGAMYSFEQSSGDGFLLMPEGVEGSGPPPPARTQATLTSYGAEPQTQLLLFAGFVLNVGCVNDLWRVTISLDAASMPVPSWEQLLSLGAAEPSEPLGSRPLGRLAASFQSPTASTQARTHLALGGGAGVGLGAALYMLLFRLGGWRRSNVIGSKGRPALRQGNAAVCGAGIS